MEKPERTFVRSGFFSSCFAPEAVPRVRHGQRASGSFLPTSTYSVPSCTIRTEPRETTSR